MRVVILRLRDAPQQRRVADMIKGAGGDVVGFSLFCSVPQGFLPATVKCDVVVALKPPDENTTGGLLDDSWEWLEKFQERGIPVLLTSEQGLDTLIRTLIRDVRLQVSTFANAPAALLARG